MTAVDYVTMTSPEEAYPDFVARFYDTVYSQIRSGVDEAFYLERIRTCPGPVLELGVGTGRLFCAARAEGADVHGIDLSPAMVARCREKLPAPDAARVEVQDAVRMRLGRRFDLILAPFRMLLHVIQVEDQLRLLDAVFDHLTPGGLFLFDVYVPSPRILADGLDLARDFEGEYAPGKRLERSVTARADVVNQVTSATMSFVWEEDGRTHRRDWDFRMRFFFRYEIEHLVARSRLRLEAIHGDFEGGSLTPDSREFVVFCKRPLGT